MTQNGRRTISPENSLEAVSGQRLGRARPLADQVFDVLKQNIIESQLKPGDRLPTEPELSLTFGVSRSVIREAVTRLRSDGIVITKQGAGMFVADSSAYGLFRLTIKKSLDLPLIREVFELRIAVEIEAAALAAERCEGDDIERISNALVKKALSGEGNSHYLNSDFAFHRAIAMASGNSQVLDLLDSMLATLFHSLSTFPTKNPTSRNKSVTEIRSEHKAIFASISTRSPEKAREAMRRHLMAAQDRLGLTSRPPGILT